MGGLIGEDTPLVTLSCINVRDTGDVNITRVDGKGREKKKEEEEKKFFCFRIRKKKRHVRGEEENSFKERRARKASKFV